MLPLCLISLTCSSLCSVPWSVSLCAHHQALCKFVCWFFQMYLFFISCCLNNLGLIVCLCLCSVVTFHVLLWPCCFFTLDLNTLIYFTLTSAPRPSCFFSTNSQHARLFLCLCSNSDFCPVVCGFHAVFSLFVCCMSVLSSSLVSQ